MMLTKKQKDEIRNKSLSDVSSMKIEKTSGTDEPITKAISLTEQAVIKEILKEIDLIFKVLIKDSYHEEFTGYKVPSIDTEKLKKVRRFLKHRIKQKQEDSK